MSFMVTKIIFLSELFVYLSTCFKMLDYYEISINLLNIANVNLERLVKQGLSQSSLELIIFDAYQNRELCQS